jgi:hypothetical protein
MYGFEVWGLSEAWKEIDKTHSRFRKKLMGVPNCAASGFGEMEHGRDCKILVLDCVFGYRRSGKTVLLMAKEEYEREKLDLGVEKSNSVILD